MDHRLVEAPRVRGLDGEMLKEVEELSVRWFGTSLSELSIERKLRLLPYLFRTRRTSSAEDGRPSAFLGLAERNWAERAGVGKDGRGKDEGKREGRDGGEWRWDGIDN